MYASSAIGLEDSVDKKQLARLWGSDPVHLTPEGQAKFAEKIVEKVADQKSKRPASAAEVSKGAPNLCQEAKEDSRDQQKRPHSKQVGRQPVRQEYCTPKRLGWKGRGGHRLGKSSSGKGIGSRQAPLTRQLKCRYTYIL